MKNKIIGAISIGIAAALAPSIQSNAETIIPKNDVNEAEDGIDFNEDGDKLDDLKVTRDDEAFKQIEDGSIQEGTEGLDDPIWIATVEITDQTPTYEYEEKDKAEEKKQELEEDGYEVTTEEETTETITDNVIEVSKEDYDKADDDQKLDPIYNGQEVIDTESDPKKVTKEEYDKAEDEYKLDPVVVEDIKKDFSGYKKVNDKEYNKILALPTKIVDGVEYHYEEKKNGEIIYYKIYKEELEDKTQCLIIANSGNVGSHIEGEAHIGTTYYYYDEHKNFKTKQAEAVDLSSYKEQIEEYYNEDGSAKGEDIAWNTKGQYFYGEQTTVIDKGGIYKINGTNASRISLQTSEKVTIIIESDNDTGYVPTATTKKDFQPNQTANQRWDFGDIFPNLTFISKLKNIILTSNNNLGDVIAPESKIKAYSGNFCGQLICDTIENCAEGHLRKLEGKSYMDSKTVKESLEYYLYNTKVEDSYIYKIYEKNVDTIYKVTGVKTIKNEYYGNKKKTEKPPVTPPETPPEVPPTPPVIPPLTPDVPPVTPPPAVPDTPIETPTIVPTIVTTNVPATVVTIEENEVPLAGNVLGAKRARGQVLGAKRSRGSVLGARRTPNTADANSMLAWASMFGIAAMGLGLLSIKKKK